MNNQHQKFSAVMSRFLHKIMIMDRAEKLCYGVTLSQSYTIGTIYRKEMLTMNELSQELGLALSTLTRIVDVLVRDGIICRNQNEQDRRKVCVCLTEKGKELAGKLECCTNQFWTRIFDAITDEKKDEMIEDLTILLNVIEKAEQACCAQV